MKDDSPFLHCRLTMNIHLAPWGERPGLQKEYAHLFEKNGYEFNGYLFARFIYQILGEKAPGLLKNLTFQPAYERTDITFIDSWEDLRRFQEILVPIFQNTLLLESYIQRANEAPESVKGTKVAFYSYPYYADEIGQLGQQARHHLQDFAVYTLAELRAGPRYGEVVLEEFPGKSFHAFLFSFPLASGGRERHVV